MLTRKQLADLRRAPAESGNRIKEAMRLGGVTQVQLAQAIGIAQSQVSEDAAGKFSAISLDKSRAYARYFGCTVDDLFPVQSEAVA